MKPIYLRTRLPIGECRRRLEDRVGKPRWRLAVVGFGRHCDKPLQGTVESGGFDVAETGPRGWGRKDPLVRGRWAALGQWTVMRLQPYVTRGSWAGRVFDGVVCGGALTFLVLAVAGSMSLRAAGACLLGCCAVCVAALLWLHSHRLSSLGRDLARRFAVLFEAEPIEQAEGRQLEMHFGA